MKNILELLNEKTNFTTKDGHSVRIICSDRKCVGKWKGVIIGLMINHKNTYETIVQYDIYGKQVDGCHNLDLILEE